MPDNEVTILRKPIGSIALEDNLQWCNRFEVRSETSSRVYVIAQHKKKLHFACSCPGWRRHRHCKHLMAIGLPGYEKPYVIKID